jgi:hypothetical protein
MPAFLATCIRSRWVAAACALVVLLAALLPPGKGLGIPLCHFRTVTGLPCLACGLTRSFIGMGHLDVAQAAFFHPVGVVLFPLVLLIALAGLMREPLRERLVSWAERHRLLLNVSATALLAVFVVYGFGRMIYVLATNRPSPW